MATKKQKQDLLQALKFTPRDIRISLWGYGGEIVMGKIDEATYDFWSRHEDQLGDYVYDWGDTMDVPADADFAPGGTWYDVSDICHESGVELSGSCGITITDELTGETIFETNLEINNLQELGVDVECVDEEYVHQQTPGSYVFFGQSTEKGVFLENTVRITSPFDPAKLRLTYGDYEGWELCSYVEYDGQDIEGHDGYNTRGKGSDFRVFAVEKDEDWDPAAELEKISLPVLDGEEVWSSRMIDYAEETEYWEGHALTPWWSATDLPVRPGRYQVLIGNWPFPQYAEYQAGPWPFPGQWIQEGEKVEINQWRGLAQDPG